ncbi:hypothetical protein F5148DRAFT_1301022 [Russula earlei]|uniref:Uncharacterized protein n=1 Tax=Russula earlei TaxID=71964 RepID=A0ACC0TYA1_9AGAM|nr:hypothetical protein F5148DRAFT_1301022 [Russula earlei]
MSSIPPPVPALVGLREQGDPVYPSPPHPEEPLLAPRPHKLTPDLPAEMARTLDSQVSAGVDIPPSLPSHLTPGFPVPSLSSSPGPLPPPAGSSWSPWNITQSGSPPPIQTNLPSAPAPDPEPLPYPWSPPLESLTPPMASLSISNAPPKKGHESNGPPSLTAPFPTIASLIAASPSAQNNSPASKVAWCRDVIGLVERLYVAPNNQTGSADSASGPIHVADQELNDLVEIAIPMILQIANPNPVPQPLPLHVSEAIYLRATFEATGAYPQHVQQNPRLAFRDFERAARAGFSAAWFKLGRDYENFGDFSRAKDCYERGIRKNNESCLYRMGMAHLMAQLGLSASPEDALPLLQRAATLATVDVPQPAYVFGLLLLGEFSHVSIPTHLFTPIVPPGSTRENEARRHLERAAYLNFAAAQYKLGHAYEFAQPPFPFDALLSVQYYSLASQQGEIEADMALSKWFLCGSEGAFDKDESLAFTFAEKAARKGLPSAEFAMGYYMEVGVGGPKDIEASRKWYTRASQHGNTDATERLAALSQPAPLALSRQEHDNLTETTLVRKRTQAKQRSDARGPATGPRHGARQNGQQVVANIRKNSLPHHPGPNRGYPPSPNVGPVRQGTPPDGYLARPSQSLQQLPPLAAAGGPGPGPGSGPNAGGYRGPMAPGPGPGPRQPQPQSVPAGPGQSPRIPAQQPPFGHGQLSRPSSQSQLGGPMQPGQPGRRPPRGGTPSDPPLARPPPAKGPATFQEMGFQSQKLEERDCVIM